MIRRRLAVTLLLVAAALLVARGAHASTFYVSPSGSDSAAGGLASPWRTVKRVDNTSLAPGDTVLFAGGATFSDTTLMPRRSGAAGAPITFGSYGLGQATLTKGAWLDGISYLTFDSLTVDASGASSSAGISTARSGAGSSWVTVTNCRFVNVELGISIANRADSGWRVEGTLIQHTGDSGVLTVGRDSTFTGNTILDTGENAAITYGKHGIYAKGPGLTFTGNTIRRFSADGISLRYHDAVARGNTISDGGIGIAWFQQDTTAGTTTVADNTITGTRSSGVYVSASDAGGATRESFVITGNTVVGTSGNGMDIRKTTGSLTLVGNALSGAISPALRLEQPDGTLIQHDNTLGAPAPAATTTSSAASAPTATPAAAPARRLLSALSPTTGSTVNRLFTIRAVTAPDAVRVRFALDGRVVCTDTHAPFACSVRTSSGVHHIVLSVRASSGASATGSAVLRVRR